MHWLSFFIGALLGWLIEWLIDYLVLRPRRTAAEAELHIDLESSRQGAASSQVEMADQGARLVRLREADRLAGELNAHLARQADLDARLARARAEADSLRAQLAGAQDLQTRLSSAQREVASLKAQLAGMADLRVRLDNSEAEAREHVAEIERLRADLVAARQPGGTPSSDLGESLSAVGSVDVAEVQAEIASPPAGTEPALADLEPSERDELTSLEGIGPKISELLNENGIYTFTQLAGTSVERLAAILALGGPRFQTANPETWAQQAMLARDGKWEELKELQDRLRGGRQV